MVIINSYYQWLRFNDLNTRQEWWVCNGKYAYIIVLRKLIEKIKTKKKVVISHKKIWYSTSCKKSIRKNENFKFVIIMGFRWTKESSMSNKFNIRIIMNKNYFN